MVVFTCQHCKASLKRVAVSKHYATVCRRTPYLTCIGCSKDFRGDDYNAHMTCVTEDERCGDKNYKAKRTGVKQKSWIDVVHLCADRNKDSKYKELFAKLVTHENIPRKKIKFMNFVKASLPRSSPKELADEVFDFIELEFCKQKTERTAFNSEDADNEKIKNKKANLKNLNNSHEEAEIKENLQNNHDINLDPEKKLSKKELNKLKKQQKYEAKLKNIAESKENKCEIDVNGNGIEGGKEEGKVSKKRKNRKVKLIQEKKQKIEA